MPKNNSSHIINCPYLKCDDRFTSLGVEKWDNGDEYLFLRKEFNDNSYTLSELKKIVKFYYTHLVYIFRYDMFYSVIFAVNDHISHLENEERAGLLRSLEPPMTHNNVVSKETWDFSNASRGKLYQKIQLFTKNGNYRKKTKFNALDINRPTLGSTLGASDILHLSAISNAGYYTYRDSERFDICKKMMKVALVKNNEKQLIELVFNKEVNYLKWVEKERKLVDDNISNKIVFCVARKLGICGNCRYILNTILEDNAFDQYSLIWLSDDPASCEEIDSRLKIVTAKSEEALNALRSARIVIYDDFLPICFIPSKKQLLVNLWHGAINYKKIGFEGFEFRYDPYKKNIFEMENPEPNFMVAGSESFLETTSRSFHYDKSIFIKSGLPRNDVLFNKSEEKIDEIKEKLGIDKSKKIIMYAPTWRRGLEAYLHDLDITRVIEACNKRFGGDYVFMYRGHPFTRCFDENIKDIIDVSKYPDSGELVLISDILITDYSSIAYDAAIAQKKVFLYVPDVEEYISDERGFFIDLKTTPFTMSTDTSELVSNIDCFDEKEYAMKIADHLKETGSFDKGDASQKVIEKIKELL